MSDRQGSITFRNEVQAALWECEILGQLSDGYWENSKPYDHWKPWHRADVRVGTDVGRRGFWTRREGYNLTNKMLLDCVGERMLGYAKLALQFGHERAYVIHDHVEVDAEGPAWIRRYIVDEAAKGTEHYVKIVTELGKIDLYALGEVMRAETFTMTDLRRELRDMMQIMKTDGDAADRLNQARLKQQSIEERTP
jgi:hypothetical protein